MDRSFADVDSDGTSVLCAATSSETSLDDEASDTNASSSHLTVIHSPGEVRSVSAIPSSLTVASDSNSRISRNSLSGSQTSKSYCIESYSGKSSSIESNSGESYSGESYSGKSDSDEYKSRKSISGKSNSGESNSHLSRSTSLNLPKLSSRVANSPILNRLRKTFLSEKSNSASPQNMVKSRKGSIVHLHQLPRFGSIDPFHSTVERLPSSIPRSENVAVSEEEGIDHFTSTVDDRWMLGPTQNYSAKLGPTQNYSAKLGPTQNYSAQYHSAEQLNYPYQRVGEECCSGQGGRVKENWGSALSGTRRGTCYYDAVTLVEPILHTRGTLQSTLQTRDRLQSMYSSCQSLKRTPYRKKKNVKRRRRLLHNIIPQKNPKPMSLFDKLISAVSKCTVCNSYIVFISFQDFNTSLQ